MTLRTSLEASKKLKEAGYDQTIIPGDWYHVRINGKDRHFLLSEQEDEPPSMYHPIRSFSLDELLQTKEARERDIRVGWDNGSLIVDWWAGEVRMHDCGADMQQALDFIAELIQEAPCQK